MVIFSKTFYCNISRVPPSNDSLFYQACDSSLNFRIRLLPHRSHTHHRFILLSPSDDHENPRAIHQFSPQTWTPTRPSSRCSFSPWARVRGCGVTTFIKSSKKRPSWWRSRPNSAPCGLCRRKCRSRRFPSSWRAPLSELLTPNTPQPGRAATSCRTLTEGVNFVLIRFVSTRCSLCDQFPLLSLCRHYEYIFGSAKRSGKNKSRRHGSSDLSELQVWITSADSDCDAYPNVKSDESCE